MTQTPAADIVEQIAAELTRGEKLHVLRLGVAPEGGLPRRQGWKARAVMMKGLSGWVDWDLGTEQLTPLGLAVHNFIRGETD